jgi:hypothetical protein
VPRNVIWVFGGLYWLPGIGNTLTVGGDGLCGQGQAAGRDSQ